MDFYLQFGYGMMEHCRQLISAWEGGTVILSPRDLSGEQLERLAEYVADLPDGNVLLDPQCYLPNSDHPRLCSHDFWPSEYESGTFWAGKELEQLVTKLHQLNQSLGTEAFILPGMHASNIDDDWIAIQQSVLQEAQSLDSDLPLYATIALTSDALKTEEQIGLLLEDAQENRADGYYLVCEHPNGDYLSTDPNWLANVLDIIAGLRLLGSKVVVGYCNHQMLIAAAAKATAMCSGTWMNVRSFPPEKFETSYEDEIRQRAKWYYCPQAYSEYKIPFLDVAYRQGVLDRMAPPDELDGGYATALFSGTLPSTVDFTEQAAFRHYLHALRGQTMEAEADTFNDTVDQYESSLDEAEELVNDLGSVGVRGQQREFSQDVIDANRAALSILKTNRGALLRREWDELDDDG